MSAYQDTSHRIERPDDIERGAQYLRKADAAMARAIEEVGAIPLRRRRDGFAPLLDAIISQQISVGAANAIGARMKAARLTGPRKIMWASDDELRACGLSAQKIRYARALASARIDFAALRGAPAEEVINTLTEVPGIGRWTAEIYLMFSLGHPDVFAPGDLALQESTRLLYDLDERPSERDLRQMSAAWAPWRGVAARVLWAYYRVKKEREGIR